MKKIILLTFASVVCCLAFNVDAQTRNWLDSLKTNLPKPPICGSDAQDRIFGGNEAALDDHPWLVQLYYEKPKGNGFFCVGSLINERYVLTDAVCVKKIPDTWNLTSVRIGEWNTQTKIDCSPDDATFCAPPVRDIKIADSIVHPDYKKYSLNQHNDIALLRLAETVIFNDFVKPICLPLDSSLWSKDFTGHTFENAGWGKTENSTLSETKRKVVLPFFPDKECRKSFRGRRIVIDSQVCAGGVKGKDSCKGDSGGPLMSYNTDSELPYWVQIGIVSYGVSACGTEGVPGVYTKVSSFMQWIGETIRA